MDLSRIPEPLRGRLVEQLERLPPEVRAALETKLAKLPTNQLEAVLQKTSPMLERLAHKPGGKGSSAGAASAGGKSAGLGTSGAGRVPTANVHRVYDPHDHYNNTIQRGDRDSPPMFVIVFIAACAAVFAQTLGWFGG